MSDPWIKGWMGKYPRKGADWSLEEDAALLRAYESGRHLNKDIAAMHMREPVAIERRLGVLRNYRAWDEARKNRGARLMLDEGVFGGTPGGGKTWASERETAQRALDEIRRLFADFMRSQPRSTELTRLFVPPGEKAAAPGDIFMYGGEPCCVLRVEQGAYGSCIITVERCSNFPPEIAQALQFGGES